VARYVVDVMPKPEILDPQGKAVLGALPRLGFTGVSDVRQGKRFELEVEGDDQLERVRQMAETLLANPVIEDFTVASLEPDASVESDASVEPVETTPDSEPVETTDPSISPVEPVETTDPWAEPVDAEDASAEPVETTDPWVEPVEAEPEAEPESWAEPVDTRDRNPQE
jgi:phosphoribosylformylglycinamidine synthase PurS subunit